MDGYYQPLNIHIVLVHIELWMKNDFFKTVVNAGDVSAINDYVGTFSKFENDFKRTKRPVFTALKILSLQLNQLIEQFMEPTGILCGGKAVPEL